MSTVTKITQGQACYHSHKPFELGGGIVVGGNCHTPICADADIYIGLDRGAPQSQPWDSDARWHTYPITDMAAPPEIPNFRRMIDWLAAELKQGRKVHVGCIGGHGRTGIVLSALVKAVTGERDAIQWVRDTYCQRVVESSVQIDFLADNYGIKKVKASKQAVWTPTAKDNSFWESRRERMQDHWGRAKQSSKTWEPDPDSMFNIFKAPDDDLTN